MPFPLSSPLLLSCRARPSRHPDCLIPLRACMICGCRLPTRGCCAALRRPRHPGLYDLRLSVAYAWLLRCASQATAPGPVAGPLVCPVERMES
jgi:hypothetical protein